MKKGWTVIMAVLALFSFFGCKKTDPDEFNTVQRKDGLGDKAVRNESGIAYFSYNYGGSIGGDSWTVEIERQEDDSALICYDAMEYGDLGTMEMAAGKELFDELERIYAEHELYRWEGYSKYDTGVLDGSGFGLNITFLDKKHMSASGDNVWPDGYHDFISDFRNTVAPYLQEMLDKAAQEKIEEGVSGPLQYVMINYMQRGDSGSDKYEILLMRQREGGRKNFDVRITSESGEFIEPGTYNYYYDLPDEEIGFEEIAALFEKYELMKWYNWDKAAEDYNNAEWFQLSFSFEEGNMNAMGTEYPENYDEFRSEVLQHIVRVIRAAEAKHEDFRSR